LSLALAFAFGCGSQEDSNSKPGSGDDTAGDDTAGSGNGGNTNTPDPGDPSNGDVAPIDSGDLIVVPPPPVGGTDAGTGATPGSNEDTCDGIDNDGNGIIDDVDVGRDGICDCLMIATLGEPGVWGEGDVFATWLD